MILAKGISSEQASGSNQNENATLIDFQWQAFFARLVRRVLNATGTHWPVF